MPSADNQAPVASRVALACRILAVEGVAREISGHVSARSESGDTMWIRCRGPAERGLRYTAETAVVEVPIEDAAAQSIAPLELPLEHPLHSAIYAARPDVQAVVHAHAPFSMICAGLDQGIRPVVGAYDTVAVRMVLEGVDVFPSASLVRSLERGRAVAATLGGGSACLMQGHGLITVGRTIDEAVVRAVKLENLAHLSLAADQAGSDYLLNGSDQAEIVELRNGTEAVLKNQFRWTFQHYASVALAATAAHPLPESTT